MKTAFLTLFTLLAIAFVISRLAKYVLRKTLTDYDNKADELEWEQYSFTPPNNDTTETLKDKEIEIEGGEVIIKKGGIFEGKSHSQAVEEEAKERCETSRLVLKVTNDDSSRKRQNNNDKQSNEEDFNDIQNLTNYNQNVYRAKNGRFKSIK
jgi:hypothetical protein